MSRAMITHMDRLSLPDVPEPGTELYDDHCCGWDMAFQRINASAGEVDRASLAVMAAPPSWWRDQLPAILKAIDLDRSTNPARPDMPDDVPATREDAERASRTCEMCTGSGWAEVFHRGYTGAPTIDVVNSDHTVTRIPARFRLACICAAGRWLLAAHERSAADAETQFERDRRERELRTIRGIERVMQGHTEYQCSDPTWVEGVDVPETRSDWRAHVRAWADARCVAAVI